jgi:hypothetical protein
VEDLKAADDTAESDWLEMKSGLNISKVGAAKIAKFILGAANRDPARASRTFDGYAVMVLGVARGTTPGIPIVEDLELERLVQPFLGSDGPSWETQRVSVADDRDVLIIIVDPPKAGDPMYVCRKEGDGVLDGAVYFRGRGETRAAKSPEVDMLRIRERSGAPAVGLDVSVQGPVRRYLCDRSVLDEYVERRRQELLAKLPQPRPAPTTEAGRAAVLASIVSDSMTRGLSALMVSEDRTEDAYRQQVEQWALVSRRCLLGVVDGHIEVHAAPTTFVIRNTSTRYLSDVQVDLHLAGEVERIEVGGSDLYDPRDFLPRSPRPWGPYMRDLGLGVPDPLFLSYDRHVAPANGPSASFSNGGSVDARFELPELRPLSVKEFSDDVVIVVRSAEMSLVHAEWTATARDLNEVLRGAFTIEIADPLDVTDSIRDALYAHDD